MPGEFRYSGMFLKRYFVQKEANRISKKFKETMSGNTTLKEYEFLPYIPEISDCYEIMQIINKENKYDFTHRFKDLFNKLTEGSDND